VPADVVENQIMWELVYEPEVEILWLLCFNYTLPSMPGLLSWAVPALGCVVFLTSQSCIWVATNRYSMNSIAHSKLDGTRAETRFGLSAKQTSPFKSAGVSVQSTAGSQGVWIRGQQLYRPSSDLQWKVAGYPLHSHLSPSLPYAIRFRTRYTTWTELKKYLKMWTLYKV